MKICLVSSSFYPATSYGGPVFSTWNLSVELAKKGYEIYVSTSDANGTDRLKNITKNKFISLNKNLFVKYYKENIINYFSLDFFAFLEVVLTFISLVGFLIQDAANTLSPSISTIQALQFPSAL